MFRKALAAALVFSCLILSGFDLLEDLKWESEHSAYSQKGRILPPSWIPHASLANNILESAVHAYAYYTSLLSEKLPASAIHAVSSSRRALELYKLHRVFLI